MAGKLTASALEHDPRKDRRFAAKNFRQKQRRIALLFVTSHPIVPWTPTPTQRNIQTNQTPPGNLGLPNTVPAS